ncbi:MAG: sodium:calcium antiporter [Planctomycetota bacterium]|jgi:cation:H+ antiporter
MDVTWAVILLVGGLVILWKSAGLLVAGAVGLAKRLGVSPLVIGLTIVAMGTSAPEVAASIAGVLRKGGLVALIRPLKVQLRTLQREIPVMLAVALLLWPVLSDSSVKRPEGIALLAVFMALILATVYLARREAARPRDAKTDLPVPGGLIKSVLFCAVGLAGLAVGAKMTVEGAVFIGQEIGLSEGVIALTIIAFGTSLPELVTCVVAGIRGEHDISIGNLVGSNIFNTLLVTGTASTVVSPLEVGQRLAAGVDYWIMIAVSAAFAILILIGRRTIGRLSGALLVCVYVVYIVYLLVFSAPV